MVVLNLNVKCDLENVTDLGGDASTPWYFTIKCTSCGTEHENEVW